MYFVLNTLNYTGLNQVAGFVVCLNCFILISWRAFNNWLDCMELCSLLKAHDWLHLKFGGYVFHWQHTEYHYYLSNHYIEIQTIMFSLINAINNSNSIFHFFKRCEDTRRFPWIIFFCRISELVFITSTVTLWCTPKG